MSTKNNPIREALLNAAYGILRAKAINFLGIDPDTLVAKAAPVDSRMDMLPPFDSDEQATAWLRENFTYLVSLAVLASHACYMLDSVLDTGRLNKKQAEDLSRRIGVLTTTLAGATDLLGASTDQRADIERALVDTIAKANAKAKTKDGPLLADERVRELFEELTKQPCGGLDDTPPPPDTKLN